MPNIICHIKGDKTILSIENWDFGDAIGIHEYPKNLRWKSIARKFWPSISPLILARRLCTFLHSEFRFLNFLRFRTLK